VAHSNLLLYDAGLQLDIPVTTMGGASVSPYIQAGAGAMRYNIEESIVSSTSTNFAANVGLGAEERIDVAGEEIGQFGQVEFGRRGRPELRGHRAAVRDAVSRRCLRLMATRHSSSNRHCAPTCAVFVVASY